MEVDGITEYSHENVVVMFAFQGCNCPACVGWVVWRGEYCAKVVWAIHFLDPAVLKAKRNKESIPQRLSAKKKICGYR